MFFLHISINGKKFVVRRVNYTSLTADLQHKMTGHHSGRLFCISLFFSALPDAVRTAAAGSGACIIRLPAAVSVILLDKKYFDAIGILIRS